MEKTTRRFQKKVTIGLDLGDKRHTFCVLDSRGEISKKGWLRNERNDIAKLTMTSLFAEPSGHYHFTGSENLSRHLKRNRV